MFLQRDALNRHLIDPTATATSLPEFVIYQMLPGTPKQITQTMDVDRRPTAKSD